MRRRFLVSCSLLWLLGTVPGFATGNIVKSDLKGTWRISLRGLTDCGIASMLATITFDTSGSGTGPLQIHGDCGDSTLPGETFTVDTLSKTGTGTATMTCGAGCEWHFAIQVTPDRTKFNLVNVTPGEDFLDGLAILSSPADHIAVADLKGTWQVVLMGRQFGDCGAGPQAVAVSAVATLTLNTAGTGNANATLRTTCGTEDVVNSFAVSGLNADGGGTAHLDCGGGCGFDFSIQVSPDRSVFNLVTVSPADVGENLSGVAIRRSTAGHIVRANLASAWQGTSASFEEDLDDAETVLATLKLNAKAQTKNATIVLHGTDGDATLTGITVSIVTLNPDGSGIARLTVTIDGGTASFDQVIQVSPDRSMMSLVTVDPGDDDDLSAGVLIAY